MALTRTVNSPQSAVLCCAQVADAGKSAMSGGASSDGTATTKSALDTSYRVIMGVSLLTSINYSMIVPSCSPYVEELGGDIRWFGITMTTFSVTRMIFFVPIGAWSDRRPVWESLVFCHVFALLDNILVIVVQTP